MLNSSEDHGSLPSKEAPAVTARPGELLAGNASANVTFRHKVRSTQKAIQKHRIGLEQFIFETSAHQRERLLEQLCLAIIFYLQRDCRVYLEGLGLLTPEQAVKAPVRAMGEKLIARREHYKTVGFEKCSELTAFHREKYPHIVEIKELAARIYPRLPFAVNFRWCEEDVQRYLRGLVRYIRHEIIVKGYSSRIKPVGVFYSLHNRQGATLKDWFAGADIFLKPNYEETFQIEKTRTLPQPEFESAWEPLEAVYGPPRLVFSVNLAEELTKLGYDGSALESEEHIQDKHVKVAVFESPAESADKDGALFYCTNGVRKTRLPAAASSPPYGSEFIFQLAIRQPDGQPLPSEEVPLWPSRPIAMAWVLLHSSKSGTLAPGAGLSGSMPLNGQSDSDLDVIFATSFSQLKNTSLCKEGRFRYVNIIGITSLEAEFAKRYSPRHLLALLEHKHLDQVTRVTRSSLIVKKRRGKAS